MCWFDQIFIELLKGIHGTVGINCLIRIMKVEIQLKSGLNERSAEVCVGMNWNFGFLIQLDWTLR